MKQLLLFLVAFFTFSMAFAQTPQLLSYQAVIRNTSNQLVVNAPLGVQISVLQGSATGTAVYVERHFPRSSNTGIVTLNIGGGTVVSGVFANINWASGTYFLKTETDLNGGANYTISGTSQMLSVPYAINAKYAETVDYNKLTNKPPVVPIAWGSISNGTKSNGSNNFTVTKASVGVYRIKFNEGTVLHAWAFTIANPVYSEVLIQTKNFLSSGGYLSLELLNITTLTPIDGAFNFVVYNPQ
jgi:hypothetical protein